MNPPNELNPREQKIALTIARQSLEAYFAGRDYVSETEGLKIFDEPAGVFVTLRQHGELRGCIGVFEPNEPLAQAIKKMALAAALEDDRFEPLSKDEMDETKIEISILSPMEKVASADEIELNKHGVFLKQGRHNGVFLPQVAEETGWNKETFLDTLCTEKAGLGAGCWREPRTEIFVFTTQDFRE